MAVGVISVDGSHDVMSTLKVGTFAAWLAASSISFVIRLAVLIIVIGVVHVHAIIAGSAVVCIVVASEARASSSASAWPFVMASQSVSSGELASALVTCVWAFSGMKLRVSLQIVQPPEAGRASLADIRLLLAVGKQMTF